jgi:hypothetical protein
MIDKTTFSGPSKLKNPLVYNPDEIEDQIEAIPPQDGAAAHPSIFDLIMQAYLNTKTDDLLSNGQGGSINTKSAASPLGRGANAFDDQPSSPESVDHPDMKKLQKYMQMQGNT